MWWFGSAFGSQQRGKNLQADSQAPIVLCDGLLSASSALPTGGLPEPRETLKIETTNFIPRCTWTP